MYIIFLHILNNLNMLGHRSYHKNKNYYLYIYNIYVFTCIKQYYMVGHRSSLYRYHTKKIILNGPGCEVLCAPIIQELAP
jgi:hypothetical protein